MTPSRPFFSTERRLLFLFVQVPVICIIIELKAGVGEEGFTTHIQFGTPGFQLGQLMLLVF